jgi:allophanate hydrolase subunit 1
METRFLSAGDCAFSVEFGLSIDRATSARVMALDRALAAAALPGVVEAVPTFRSLMVHYDPLVTSRAELEASIGRLVGEAAASGPEGRAWRIPVCYAGELAPDLAAVADRTGLGRSRVIELHARTPST